MKTASLTLFAAISIAGCTVLTGAPGEIAGSVSDIDGNPVRAANIFLDNNRVTESSTVGTFAIREVTPGVHTVKAELTINGVPFRGRNKTMVYEFERTTSVAVVMARVSELGNMQGRVTDISGRPLENVRVFAGGPLGSWVAFTDAGGNYRIDDLVGGYTYTVTASGRGYENDTTQFNAVAGQTRTVNFSLRNSTGKNQTQVDNLQSIAWTSPVDPTRRPGNTIAYERIKQLVDTKRPKDAAQLMRGRTMSPEGGTLPNSHIEIDLTWDYEFSNELLGYGIYRGTNPTGNLAPLDFLRDPLANFYADISEDLTPAIRYYYQVSRINTDFPPNGEGPLSADTSSVPLGDLQLIDPQLFPSIVFRWVGVSFANSYTVYLFSYFPDFQAVPIWTSAPTASNFVAYTGPNLQSGSRYYYVAVGTGYSGESFTISQIDSFVAP